MKSIELFREVNTPSTFLKITVTEGKFTYAYNLMGFSENATIDLQNSLELFPSVETRTVTHSSAVEIHEPWKPLDSTVDKYYYTLFLSLYDAKICNHAGFGSRENMVQFRILQEIDRT